MSPLTEQLVFMAANGDHPAGGSSYEDNVRVPIGTLRRDWQIGKLAGHIVHISYQVAGATRTSEREFSLILTFEFDLDRLIIEGILTNGQPATINAINLEKFGSTVRRSTRN